MAHTLKCSISSAAHILGHCERQRDSNGFLKYKTSSAIDSSKTKDCYLFRIGTEKSLRGSNYYHDRVKKIGVKRKDQVTLCDTVITLPKEYADVGLKFQQAFFKYCKDFVEQRYGSDNMVGAYVHMDESTPHIHIAWTPVKDNRFQCKNILTRSDLQTFHEDLAAYLFQKLQVPRKYILNGATKGAKKVEELKGDISVLSERKKALQVELDALQGDPRLKLIKYQDRVNAALDRLSDSAYDEFCRAWEATKERKDREYEL